MGFMNSLSMPQGGVMFPGMGSMDMSAFNPMMMPYATMPMFSGSAASFHLPGPKNEMKLFVGGLQFQTTENDLFTYFSQFGQVGDAIVMRDKQTGRGRGFGFVRLIYNDEEEADTYKDKILTQNKDPGHFILEKKVDVKSADDHQAK